ncbi:MAG: Trk system potassium transporter TrkA [Muribaculaceae bacterium]|nr:Trk system potassium transporter TrkA [Muribaculaceae bacterium]
MKIVIAGAGEVGTHLAKMLSDEEQDIVIMDNDERKLVALENYNLMTYHGSATSFEALKDVGISRTDLFIAVTPYEARNILACSLAKNAGAKKTVARIDNSDYLLKENRSFFVSRGIDHLIYPEFLAAQEMCNALKRTWVRNWFELFDGELIVVGVKVRSNSSLAGKRLKELGAIANKMHVSAIKRNRETIIPQGNDHIMANDILYIATTHDHIQEVLELCGKVAIDVNKVLIMGGGEITEQLLRVAPSKYRFKVMDTDMRRCEELAYQFPNVSIVNGDASDTDFLEEEGISDYDVFIALSDISEANILGCMMAKEHGIRKTIAQVENLRYFNEAEALNIGTIINKKLLASSRIFQIMLDSDVDNAKSLALADSEVAELVIKEGSKVTKADVKDLNLSRNMTIAGLVRNGEGYLVTGNTRLQAGDHVVIFCLSGDIHRVEKIFSK